jgi:phasin family protein
MYDLIPRNSPAAQAYLESQFSMINDLSKQMFNAVQRFNELNIQVAQTVLEESISSAKQLCSAKDPQEALSLLAGQAQPNAEKLRAYQQHLTDIAVGTQVNLAKTAESHIPQTSRTAQDLATEVARRASEETEKATQRQRAAMEKLTTPIAKPAETGKGGSAGVH